ncbi:MAG: T9SS type A sorting domain-containing protein [Bacteroidales bacterium]
MNRKIIFAFIVLFLALSSAFPQTNMDWKWVRTEGGQQTQKATSIAIDVNNDVVMAGTFTSDFILLGSNNVILSNNDSIGYASNFFVAKYNQNGQVIWAKKAFCNTATSSNKIFTDNNGNIYATGYFNTNNTVNTTISFDGVTTHSHLSGKSFLVKYSPMGFTEWVLFVNTKYWGNDSISSVKWDQNTNSLIIAGYCLGDTVKVGNYNIINSGNSLHSSFLAKISPQQGNVVWLKKTAGNAYINKINEIAVDTSGSIYTAASFLGNYLVLSSFDSITNTNPSSSGSLLYDGYFAKYDKNGILQWYKKGSCSLNDEATTITCTNNNHLVVGGYNNSTILFNNGVSLIGTNFILEYDLLGNFINAANFPTTIKTINAFKNGNGFTIGGTFTSDSITLGNINLTKYSTQGSLNTNIFIAQSNTFGTYNSAIAAGGINSSVLNAVSIGDSNKIYLCGYFNQPSMYFGATQYNANGISDLFLAKLDTGFYVPTPLKYNLGGTVFAGPLPVDHAIAYLYDININIIDSCNIDTLGFYHFYQIHSGNYKVSAKLLPNSISFNQNYITSYYPNKTNFEDADTIFLNTNRWQRDIQLQKANAIDENSLNSHNLSISNIYPNPAKDDLYLSLNNTFTDDYSVEIINANGQLLFSQKYNHITNDNTININISSLNLGLYHLLLRDAKGNLANARFIKIK